jgi:uncharacterized protein (TIGR02231 family)
MYSTRYLAAAALAMLMFLAAPAPHAADLAATLTIDQVTVYPQTAAVVRRGEVTVPAGSHRLIIRGLPDPVDPGSIRMSAGSRAVRLGGIEIEKIVAAEFVSEAERALRKKLTELVDRRAEIQDDVPTAEQQLKLIDAVASAPADRDAKLVIDGPSLSTTLSTISSGAAAARAKIRGATIAIRDLDAQIEATKAELSKVATARKNTTEVRAVIEASAAVTVPVSLEYRVTDAGWEWLYEARLDTQSKKMSLGRQAAIQQGSGEDWREAEVTVTTAKPRTNAGTPAIQSLFLRLTDRQVARNDVNLEEVIVTGSRRSRGSTRPRSEPEEEQAPLITAEEFATEFTAEYRIPGRVTITSNRQLRMYPVSEEEFDAELVARAVLSVETSARLEATFTYERDVPIEAGRLQLYRDGSYIGMAALPSLLPGSDVRVPFGVDERIRITVRDERAQSGRRGMLNKQTLSEHRRRYEITSYHGTALPIEVVDRVPVPQESDIKVEVLEGATAPTVRDLDGKEGVYLWKLPGTPKKTESIRHYYSVRYPSDRMLSPTEAGG